MPALLVLLLSACNEQLIDTQYPEGKGELIVSLDADERVEIVDTRSGTENALPSLEDFRIEIVNSKGVKFYREAYDPKLTIPINAGDYTLMAKYGDSLAFGFGKPFYMAKRVFTVESGRKVTVDATAKLANVKIAVKYGKDIQADYQDFYTVIKHEDHTSTFLKFNKDESRPGYLPGGRLSVTVYARVNGELKSYTLKDDEGNTQIIESVPNDFITLNVNTAVNDGGLSLGILIDDGTELDEKVFLVPADAVSELKPRITLSSFDADGNYYVTEGKEQQADDVSFTIKAYAGLKSCVLEIENDYMAGIGIPASIDFAAQTPEQIAALEEKGFFWLFYGGIGVIDLANFIPHISRNSIYNGRNTVAATFRLTITDETGATVTKTAKVLVRPDASAQITLKDYDIWATRLADANVTLTGGNVSLAKLQYSSNGEQWIDAGDVAARQYDITGLQPSCTYYLRVMYDGWLPVSDELPFTTEVPAQLGNSGFEDFECVDFIYTPTAGSQTSEPWYLPWKSGETDIWWDVNSKRTLRTAPTVAYQEYKCYPTVSYITSGVHGGNKAAQIASVATGQAASEIASGTSYAGELFIGRSNEQHQDDWAYASTGHSFTSRPTAFKFWYQFDAYNSESFYVKIELKDASGNVIGSAELSDSNGASSWKECTMNLNYTKTNAKAASVFVTFKSSTSSSPKVTKKKLSYHNSDDKNHYIGTVLRVDDLQLVY